MTQYYSQNGQDVYLDTQVFKGKEEGLFIEIGAHDGITFSNSYFFEKSRNWRGICIEPRKKAFNLLVKNRKTICENVCISKDCGRKKFLEVGGEREMLSGLYDDYTPDHLNRINRTTNSEENSIYDVECSPLTDITEKYGIREFDFCSIDTEGSEVEIVMAIDFSNIKIHCFIIENLGSRKGLRAAMKSKGYIFVKQIVGDDLYIIRSELAKYPRLYFLSLYTRSLGRIVDQFVKRKYLIIIFKRKLKNMQQGLFR